MIANVIILGLPYSVKCDYSYSVPKAMFGRDLIGCRVEVVFGGRRKVAAILSLSDDSGAPSGIRLSKLVRIIDEKPILTHELISLAKWMSEFYISSLSECLSAILPSGEEGYKRPPKKAGEASSPPALSKKPFSVQQQEVSDRICKAFRAGKFSMLYLKGVTGSGKSEVLLRTARKVVSEGYSVLYLVPEIALTAQLEKTAMSMFCQRDIAVVHSSLTKKMRLDIFRRCLSGDIRMVLGTRSSVFSPLQNLRLIIVDEEQDQSYKDGSSPRFHVRQIAQKRARANGSVLVFASATPSLECVSAIASHSIEKLELTGRVNGSAMPKIITVLRKDSDDVISDELYGLMREEIDNERGVILFLNRKGYLHHYRCLSCGYEKMCPDCSVSMTYHRSRNRFVCHRCGREEPYFSRCPECGSANDIYFGYGTEYVERVVKRLFPFSNVVRMDGDSTSRKGESERIVQDFENGKISVLIGTQMVSKGFNFKRLRLVGIINASQTSFLGDFRQDERLFSLLVQVAGRSGRFSKESKVIIQTDGSAIPIIRFVESGRDDLFYEREMAFRKDLQLPPFSRMARIVIQSGDEAAVKEAFGKMSFLLRRIIFGMRAEHKAEVVQAGPAPISREAGKYRMQFVLKSQSVSTIVSVLDRVKAEILPHSGLWIGFDVDPLDFS